jgi:methionine-rich copper-binding protein CopC
LVDGGLLDAWSLPPSEVTLMQIKRVLGGLLALVLSVLIQKGTVIAHAKFLRAEPAPNTTVASVPQVVRVWFTLADINEELDAKRSTLSVWDAHGKQVDDGKGGVDLNDLTHKSMIVRLQSRQPGTYTVKWKAVSSPDLEATQGSFRFTVGSSKDERLPPLSIVTPKAGATVQSPVVVVFETPADLSMMTVGEHGMAMGPHLHVELDKRLTMPTFQQVTRLGPTRYQVTVGAAIPGKHTIRMYWGSKDHKPISPVQVVTALVQ